MLAEAEQLCFHVTCVPHRDASVSRAGDHQTLVEWGVVDGHNFSNVRFDALGGHFLSHVPDFQFLIVTHSSEFVDVVVVPADVLDDLGVCVKGNQRVDGVRELVLLIDVPDVDLAVITAGEEKSALKWVPVKAIAFTVVSE